MHLQARDTGQPTGFTLLHSRALRFIVLFWQLPAVNSQLINNGTGNIIPIPWEMAGSVEASMHQRLQQCNWR